MVLSEFQAICSLQDEIAKKLCRFRIREQGARLDSATQNTIGHALAQLLDTTQGYDTTQGDGEAVSKLTIEEVFTVSRDDFFSINGAPIGRLVDENLRKERAMLAQAETKTKVPFASRINPTVWMHRLLS